MLYGCTVALQDYDSATQSGYDYVELSGKAVASMDNRSFDAFQRNLTIPVLGFNAYCPAEIVIAGPGYDRVRTRQYAEGLAPRAKALGVCNVGVGSPASRNLPELFPADLAQSQIREFLLDTADVFSRYGIGVCLEALATCFCNTVNTFDEAFDIVASLDQDNLNLVVDFYNMEHMGEADQPLEHAFRFIAHAHISDDDGKPSLRSYLKPEKRDIHRARIGKLVSLGYDKTLTLETDVRLDLERAATSLEIMKGYPLILPAAIPSIK